MSVDPLAEVITLLQPRTIFTKRISGAGPWAVRYSEFGYPSFCILLEGACRLSVDGASPLTLEAGDFVLLPATPGFSMGGFEEAIPVRFDPKLSATTTEEVRHGRPSGPPDVRILGGYFMFDSADASLLVSLLSPVIHIRGVERLLRLVQLVGEEAMSHRPGRDLVLARLVEVLLIEALRHAPGEQTPPGLLRGLADPQLAQALRQMHGHTAHPWTAEQLAKTSALSRSAFFDRFSRTIGLPPMEYLLQWRMAIAKGLLREGKFRISEVAEKVGYASTSAFSTAFSRYVGQAPRTFTRLQKP